MLDDASRQRDFPSLAGRHYLNTAAESVPPLCVGEALNQYWHDKLQGMHGREAHFATFQACREVAARMIDLAPEEVSFCSCSSEAYNLLAGALALSADDEVVISDLDFPAGATPWLCDGHQERVQLWRSRSGELLLDDLLPLLSERTALVQLSLVSFYNGHRLDWPKIVSVVRHHAPRAILSLDVTQALGRVPVSARQADIVISSTHKWTLGVHGGCVVGIPSASATRLTTRAGGWYHLENAFAADRFQRAILRSGAASYSVGMPNFAAIYALNASLRYLETIGVDAICASADPIVASLDRGLRQIGIQPMCPYDANRPTGIIAFQHERSDGIYGALLQENIHVMHHAGRLRMAVHGYNRLEDIQKLLTIVAQF